MLEQAMKAHRGLDVCLYSFFNFGARWVSVVNATLRPLYPRERPGTTCTGGWMGARAALNECGKSRLSRDLIHRRSSL